MMTSDHYTKYYDGKSINGQKHKKIRMSVCLIVADHCLPNIRECTDELAD